jgi:hypothetical protein
MTRCAGECGAGTASGGFLQDTTEQYAGWQRSFVDFAGGVPALFANSGGGVAALASFNL